MVAKPIEMEIFLTWIDHDKARLYQFTQEKMERTILHKKNSSDFMSDVSNRLKSASRILILGPGVAMQSFKRYLDENHPNIAKNIMGCEELIEPTDMAIAECAQRFFKQEAS